ncbi:hypothetical protein EMCRGX_G025944 [Ephydatia muelleri]
MPSRNRKKRTKQRAEYLQKQEENKAKARERYKADPEKKKASVRESYKADPEKKKASVRESYIANIEPKRAAKRQRYGEDLEENRAAKRQRYGEDLEENRAVKRQRYQESVEENRAAKRRIYRGNSATIKAARMSRYWKGRRTTTTTTTTTQSYSLFEPNSRTLAEYGVSLEKAILRDSELLSDVNNAFCNSHPLLAQKVVTRSARAAVKIGNRSDYCHIMSQQKGPEEAYPQGQSIPPKQDPSVYPQAQTEYQPGYQQPQPGYQPGYQTGYQVGYQPGYTGEPQPGYQPGYPQPQGYFPPPAYTGPQGQQQQTTVIIAQQPAVDESPLPRSSIFGKTKNFYFTESLMMTLVFCLFGGCPALCCTVPAIFLSLSAQKAHEKGNTAIAVSKATMAHRLIIAALIYAIVGYVGYVLICVIAAPAAVVANAAVRSSYG